MGDKQEEDGGCEGVLRYMGKRVKREYWQKRKEQKGNDKVVLRVVGGSYKWGDD